MDYIIYIYGDMQIFADMFAALSALFNPVSGGVNAFINDSASDRGVGTAVALAAIFALMTNVVSYMQMSKFEPHKATYGLMMYLVLWVPTVDTIYIADLATASPSSSWVAIDDVPIGIATIGHALSTISRTVNSSLQNDLSSGEIGGTTFNSTALKGHGGASNTGFLSPLLAILSLREIAFVRDRRIDTNVYFYSKYCISRARNAAGVTGINWRQLQSDPDPLNYLFDTSLVPNTPTKRIDSNDKVTYVNCHALASELNGADTVVGSIRNFIKYGPSINTAKFEGLVSNVGSALINEANPTTDANIDLVFTEQLDSVVGTLGFARQLQEQNWLRLRAEMAKHASSLSDTTLNSYSMVMAQNIETARMEASIKGENFLKWSFAAMTGLLFVFYALFPLIGVVMVAKGPKGIEFLGSYILFGLWIYSWQTISIIINYWSTSNFVNYVNLINGYTDLSLDKIEMYITAAQDAVSVGSNLMASVPLITYAVLTGSMFAMTQLSSVATPQGDTSKSVGNQVPQIGQNAPSVDMKSQLSQTVGGLNHGIMNASIPILQGFTASQVISDSNGTSNQYAHRETAGKEVNSAFQSVSQYMRSDGYQYSGVNSSGLVTTQTGSVSTSFADKVAKNLGLNFNDTETADFARELGARFNADPAHGAQTNKETNAYLKSIGAGHLDSTAVDAAVMEQYSTVGNQLISKGEVRTDDEKASIMAADSASTAYKKAETYDRVESAQEARNKEFANTSGGTGENMYRQMAVTRPEYTGSANGISNYRNERIMAAANQLGIDPEITRGLQDRVAGIIDTHSANNHQNIGVNRPEAQFASTWKTTGEVMNSLVQDPIAGLDIDEGQEIIRNAMNDWYSDIYGETEGGVTNSNDLKSNGQIKSEVHGGLKKFGDKASDSSASKTQKELSLPFSNESLNQEFEQKANALISQFTGQPSNMSIESDMDFQSALQNTKSGLTESLGNKINALESEITSGKLSKGDVAQKQAQVDFLQGQMDRANLIDPSAASSQDGYSKLQAFSEIAAQAGVANQVGNKVQATNEKVDSASGKIDDNTSQKGLMWSTAFGSSGFAFNNEDEIQEIANLFDSNPTAADARVQTALERGHDVRKPVGMSNEAWQSRTNEASERYNELKGQVGGKLAFIQTLYETGQAQSGAGGVAILAQAGGNVLSTAAKLNEETEGASGTIKSAGTAVGVTALAVNAGLQAYENQNGRTAAVNLFSNELNKQLNGGNAQDVLDMLDTKASKPSYRSVSYYSGTSGPQTELVTVTNQGFDTPYGPSSNGSSKKGTMVTETDQVYNLDPHRLNEYYKDEKNKGAFAEHIQQLSQYK